MKLSEGLKYSKGANFCSLISGQTRPEWNGRPVLFPTRAHGLCPSVSVRVPAPLQIFPWKNLILRSFRSCCHPASFRAVIWQDLACNLQEVEVLFVLKLPNSSLQGKQKAALLPPCRRAFCCELPPTLPNESCNVCRNAKTFAVLENVVLWKIFSCRRRFRMPPVKSSCYILLQAVLVVFPPLTLLNLRALFSLARTLDCHWQGWCKKKSPNESGAALLFGAGTNTVPEQGSGAYLYLQQSRNSSFSIFSRCISSNFY